MSRRPRPEPPPYAKPPRRRLLGPIARVLLFVFVALPLLLVIVYRFLPPPTTFLMLKRVALESESHDYRWRGLDDISPHLVRAVISSEDAKFCTHDGFDGDAIAAAMRNNERRPSRIKGGSTISQQTAKNVFLWPDRSYVRKGAEAYLTVLTETLWSKRRIMEVYLNVIEWGPGVYGAEAAARHWFKKSAGDLTRLEAARLAAILPSPRRYKAASPGPYVRRRTRAIQARMGVVQRERLAACAIG
jgi:monofunctional biosynthetic peptidoglycan transglycosylase